MTDFCGVLKIDGEPLFRLVYQQQYFLVFVVPHKHLLAHGVQDYQIRAIVYLLWVVRQRELLLHFDEFLDEL